MYITDDTDYGRAAARLRAEYEDYLDFEEYARRTGREDELDGAFREEKRNALLRWERCMEAAAARDSGEDPEEEYAAICRSQGLGRYC